MPVFLMPGNHDSRDLIRQVFSEHAYLPAQGFLQYTVEDYPLRLIMLDTNVPGEGRGELDRTRLQWLDEQLAVPSPVHQVSLDLRPSSDGAAEFATFTMEPPAYQLHLWQDGEGLVSHMQYINQYEGPYSFWKGAEKTE